jgi:hypothetical protein
MCKFEFDIYIGASAAKTLATIVMYNIISERFSSGSTNMLSRLDHSG